MAKKNISFGKLIKEHRHTRDLTQAELARRVGCATITLRKIEADSLRPSVQIAERLAMALNIPLEERADFVQLARYQSIKVPTPPPTPSPPPTPEEIGGEDLSGRAVRGYQLGEKIGSGGFGAVYRAVQPTVERQVALKIILPKYADHPDFIRRFEAEAQLVARLEHPYIVPLYDYWREPSAAYLVMRLLRGGNLEALLADGALSVEFSVQVMDQIGKALHAAHRFGVVHRDLKPANIMLDEEKNAYLADFGIAKNLGNPSQETQVGALLGTPSYMSPEQGQGQSITPHSDIYSMGVLLFEMLTGELPFKGLTPIEHILHHISDPLPPLSDFNPDLPQSLDTVIARATAKDPSDRHADVVTLLAELQTASGLGKTSTGTTSQTDLTADPAEIENPFKGLRPFGESDSEHFFGRETTIQELLGNLGDEQDLSRFLAVVGPSGSGKSSVVKAGLIPAIRRGALPSSEHWFVVDFMPGSHPWEELEAALLRVAVNPPATLLDQLKADERGLSRAVNRVLPDDKSIDLVLVIDQFEEIFTLVDDEDLRAHFMESLLAAVLDPDSRLRVVITMRADFTDRPLQYVDFGELMRNRSVFVLPLAPEELEETLTGPTRHVGLIMEPNLVTRIVREVGDQPGTLPLLQYALTELFERREGRRLTEKAYEASGGVLGALGRRAEETYTDLTPEQKKLARQLFLRLVTLGEGVEDTRRRVLLSELTSLNKSGNGKSADEIDELIQLFGRYRLLTFDRDPITRGPTVEVAHEALLREWPRFQEWVANSRASVRMQRTLSTATQEWDASQEETGYLLRGARLSQFELWAEDTDLALTEDEHSFLAVSLAEREHEEAEEAARQEREKKLEVRARKVLQRLVAVFAIATVVALYLTNFAFNQQDIAQQNADLASTAEVEANSEAYSRATQQAIAEEERNIAEAERKLASSRELAASAVGNLDVDPELSILLALQALDSTYSREAESVLHSAINAARIEMTITSEDFIVDIAYSPDGSLLISTGPDNTAILWDAVSGEQLLTFSGHSSGIEGVAFSPDGKQIATASYDNTAKTWNVATGQELITFVGHTDQLWDVAFSPDGQRLVTASIDNTAKLWDASTGEALFTLSGHTDLVNRIAYSPDGDYVATASSDETAKIWNANSGEMVYTLFGHADLVASVTFSPDSSRLATGGADGIIIIWDVASGKELRRIETTGIVFGLAFSPDGAHIGGARHNALAAVWDVASGEMLYELIGHTSFLFAIDFSPDGAHVATAGFDRTARIWSTSPVGLGEQQIISGYPFTYITYSPDGNKMATLLSDTNGAVYDTQTGQELVSVAGHPQGAYKLIFSPDGSLLASAGWDNTAKIWDADTGEELFTLAGHLEAPKVGGLFTGVLDVAFHPDGVRLASGGADGQLIIWDVTTRESLLTIPAHELGITNIEFTHDGTKLISASDEPQNVANVGPTAKVWDTNTGELLLTIKVEGRIWGLAVSPDDSRIVTAGAGGFVYVWDSATGELLHSLVGHSSTVGSVVYNVQGTMIATEGGGGIKVWDAFSGELLLSLSDPDGSGFGRVAFSPDGTILAASSSKEGTIRFYILDLDLLVALAQTRVTRSLTDEECGRLLHLEVCPSE